jgi:hypothetical protein
MRIWLVLAAAICSAQVGDVNLIGAAQQLGDRVRLTPTGEMLRGAMWKRQRVRLREGFRTSFRFRLSEGGGLGQGADGFAFVIQNNGDKAIAGRGASGGFGFGDGRGDRRSAAILNSLAVFFDTFQNPEDESDNSVSICTAGGKKELRWPPPRLGVNWRPPMQWKDGSEHEVDITFAPPLMTVTVDGTIVLRAPVDLARMLGADGMGYVGFTAATGNGWENHDVWDWKFESVDSNLYSVDSTIQFARVECMPGKSLCTPSGGNVEALGRERLRVLLPAHRPWSVAFTPTKEYTIENVRGNVCWDLAKGLCGVPKLLTRVQGGRVWFAIEDDNYADNEGYVEFDVVLK